LDEILRRRNPQSLFDAHKPNHLVRNHLAGEYVVVKEIQEADHDLEGVGEDDVADSGSVAEAFIGSKRPA